MIGHGIGQSNGIGPQIGLNPPAKPQMFAEDGCLADFALRPQRAGVRRAPLLAIPDESGREVGDAAVQSIPGRLAKRVVVLRGVDLGGEQRVVEPGRHHQTREGAQPGQSILVAKLVQARMTETGRRPPAERAPGVLGRTDVHCPIHQHVEPQSGAGAKLESPNATFGAVVQHHATHSTQRAWIAGESR
jgi:hypothetical protein